jgi:type IV secretory pathway VirB4 component
MKAPTSRLRPVGRLRLQPHRASSATLAGAYPFLAVAPPTRGVPVGVDVLTGAPFAFDPWALYEDGWLTNPNMLLAGVIGQGKSALAKSLAIRSIAAGRRVYVAGDPKGEWATVADAVSGQVVRLGPGLPTRLNPFDKPARAAEQDESNARPLRLLASLAQQSLGRPLRPVEHTVMEQTLTAVAGRGTVTLPRLVAALMDRVDPAQGTPQSAMQRDGRDVAHAVRRIVHGDLAGLFDGPSTVRLDPAAPMVVLDLSLLAGHDDAVTMAMTCGAAWMDSALSTQSGQRWIVYDEAWRMLRSLPLIRHMQAQWKLSRALGIANLIVLHRLSDLDAAGAGGTEARAVAEGLLADCSTRVVYRQESDQLAGTGAALGLGDTERDLLPHLTRGTGLWKLPGRSYLVRHDLHPAELPIIDTDAALRDKDGRP